MSAGPDQLTDTELLAILLRQGAQRITTVELARHLIEQFGGLRGTLNAKYHDLRVGGGGNGIGQAKEAVILASRAISERFMTARLQPGSTISSPTDSCTHLIAALRDLEHEYLPPCFSTTGIGCWPLTSYSAARSILPMSIQGKSSNKVWRETLRPLLWPTITRPVCQNRASQII